MKNLMMPWRNPVFLLALLIAAGLAFLNVKDAKWYRERKESQNWTLLDVTPADTFSNGVNLNHIAGAVVYGILPFLVATLNLLAALIFRRDRALGWLVTFPVILGACMAVFWMVN